MKIIPYTLLAIFTLGALAITPTQARTDDYDKISLSLGLFDALDGDDSSSEIRAEYRWDQPLIWQIKPLAGIEYTTDGSGWLGAGLYYDHHFADKFVFTPSLSAGLYNEGGGKDMGGAIQFRSQVEVGYEFDNQTRLSAGFSHMSNAGLDDENPGAEILSLYYHMPVGVLFPSSGQ